MPCLLTVGSYDSVSMGKQGNFKNEEMRLYSFLSDIKFLRTYSYKLLLIAFCGIQLPLLGLGLLLAYGALGELVLEEVLLLVFGFTFLLAAINLFVLNQMMIPVRKAKDALLAYTEKRELPQLPVRHKDEVGVLMRSVQSTIINLDHVLQEKQDLMALLSHDIRSPINTASSLTELIRIKSDDPEIKDYCEKIQQQNGKQIRLLNAVLELLKEDQHEMNVIQSESVLVEELIKDVVENLSLEIKQKGLEVKISVPKKLRINVQRTIFNQVLTNLLHNAIKFSPREEKIRIEVKKNRRQVQINLVDQGIGFSSTDDIQRVFDRFTHLKRKGTEGEPTTGVGLYLSRKIVRQHKGEIEAYSAGENKGSTFSITLPV